MNVLFFTRLFYPHIGGVEKHVLEISRLLIKKGYKVAIVTEQHEKKLKCEEELEGIKVYRIPDLKEGRIKKFKIWKWLWENRSLIGDADVIHCHDVFFWYMPFRFLYFSKPVFSTFHGYESYPLSPKFIFMHKIAEKLSRGNICIGSFMKKWYSAKPNYVSYGGVNVIQSEKRPARHASQGVAGGKAERENSAIFIGRLDDQTGILIYVKAVEIIMKKISNFEFLVIGDGKLKDKIDKKIKILKPQDHALEYFKDYNFAFVSRYLSILEALAAKKLVFAVYDNPLKEDYLRMAPFSKYIVIFSSTSELVSKISFYLDNLKEKKKIIDGAYNWVIDHTWEAMTNTYLKLWKVKS